MKKTRKHARRENNNISILSHQLDNSFSRILDKPKKKSLVLQHSILGNIKEDLFCDTPTTIPKIKNEIHLPPLPNFNIPQYKDEQITNKYKTNICCEI